MKLCLSTRVESRSKITRQCVNRENMSCSIPSSLKDTPIVDIAEAAARKAFVSFHVASGGILLAMSVFHCSICRDTTVNVSTFDALNGRAGRVSLSYMLPSDSAKVAKRSKLKIPDT